jgi:hypothetical protein
MTARHVTRVGETRNAYRMFAEIPAGKILLPTLGFGIGGVEPFGSITTVLVRLVTTYIRSGKLLYCQPNNLNMSYYKSK